MGDFEPEAVLQWGPGATRDHSDPSLLVELPGVKCLQPPLHGGHMTSLKIFSLAQ